MSKGQKKNIERKRIVLIIIAIISAIVNIGSLAAIFTILYSNVVSLDAILIRNYAMLLLLLWSLSLFGLTFTIQAFKYAKIQKNNEKKVKECLSKTEFSQIEFISWRNENLTAIIPKEFVQCVAKLDEDGNIIYKIHIDIEASTKDYTVFQDYFDVK